MSDKLWNIAFWGSFIALLITLVAFLIVVRQKIERPFVVTPEIKVLMTYHGISSLTIEHDGKMWFMRDGKKIWVKL
jgi:hypothetical protein